MGGPTPLELLFRDIYEGPRPVLGLGWTTGTRRTLRVIPLQGPDPGI